MVRHRLCWAAQLIFQAQKTDGKYPQVQYYSYPEDIDALRESIVAKNYPVSGTAVRFYGMKEFELTDPDGHMVRIAVETEAESAVSAPPVSALRRPWPDWPGPASVERGRVCP